MSREDLKIITNRPAISHEQAAEVLFNCATLLQMAGANQYRIARYRQAAMTLLRSGPAALEAALDEELWPKLGLGKRLGAKMRELVLTGTMNFYVELKADLPPAEAAANVALLKQILSRKEKENARAEVAKMPIAAAGRTN